MGETIVSLGLYTLRDFNSTESKLKAKDHLFCITYFYNHNEYEVMLLWRRGKNIFIRNINIAKALPQDTESVRNFNRLINTATRLLAGESVNLLSI